MTSVLYNETRERTLVVLKQKLAELIFKKHSTYKGDDHLTPDIVALEYVIGLNKETQYFDIHTRLEKKNGVARPAEVLKEMNIGQGTQSKTRGARTYTR